MNLISTNFACRVHSIFLIACLATGWTVSYATAPENLDGSSVYGNRDGHLFTPVITLNPSNRAICAGGNTTFSTATLDPASYQWQENSGSGFVNLTDGGVFSGTNTATLTITGAPATMNGYMYRCRATNTDGFTNSNAATLNISNISLSGSHTDVTIAGGGDGTATVTPSRGIGSYSYSWAPSGGTGKTATGLSTGEYTVTVTDAIGCSATYTVSITEPPGITSATYNAATGVLVVTGTYLLPAAGSNNDIIANKFTFTGEGGATYTLTDTENTEITSGTSFTLALSATDLAGVNQIMNKNGTSSTSGTTYNLAAAEDWAAGADPAVVTANTTGNGITVSNVAVPDITSAAYDAATGTLMVAGTGLLSAAGSNNDIVANKFTFTGEGGATHTITDTEDTEITSGTGFTLTLSATDRAEINQIINKNGTSSTGGTTYNLAAAEDWAAGADPAVVTANTTGNGITVSNVAVPAITSAAYDAATGTLTVAGTGFLSAAGSNNDIVANKFTFTGEGGATYTLTDTADPEITSGTSFTLTLSATDRAGVYLLMNKNGTSSTGGTTYNLAAAEDWAAGADPAVGVADITGNSITVSNVAVPEITSATYDAATGTLTVTGTGFLSLNGANNDIVANRFTFIGEGGATYTLTDTENVEITSGTSFTLVLSATDRAMVNQIMNKNGTSSTNGTTFTLAAAEDWAAGADAAVVVADTTGNGITVSNVAVPTITGATYDAATGTLTVMGAGFLSAAGSNNDIVANKFTFTGEGGATYTLIDTADPEITSGTSFTLALSAMDRAGVNPMINKNGTSSTDGTTYNLAAAEDWAAGADPAVVTANTTGNGITVSNVAVPAITSAAYDAATGTLTVAGTGFLSAAGSNNDIVANKFTFTGEGGATYTLTDTADPEITSGTSFTLALSVTDRSGVYLLMNKNGTSSTGGTTYNLAAAEDWAAGADPAVVTANTTGNSITVSNVAVPEITSATYDANTGTLTVTGTGFLSLNGATNDIVANKFTFTGEGGATYTLTDTENVEITSGTSFTLVLSATDRAMVNQIVNKNGTSSTNGTTYRLAAAEDWAAGADAAVVVADTTGNGITVSNVAVPEITSATYDASTGTLTVTGTGFLPLNGVFNDIDASRLTFTGEGGETYKLTNTQDGEITSGTSFTLTLSATDRAGVNPMINKNGTSSTGGTTYNVAAAEDWAAGADPAVVVADVTGNGITVSNVAVPAITSAAYDAATGMLTVAGTGFLSAAGSNNDIVANKFTFTGEGGATYTLTDTEDTEITSGTSFTLALSATDRAAANLIMSRNGNSATDNTSYNLAAAEDWAAGADPATDIVDATGNGITVSNVAVPKITSATYDASTGVLVVTGTGFLSKAGANNDIVADKFTFTGEGGATYTLTDTEDVDITSGTSFTLVLSATDRAEVNQIMNKNGTSSTNGTTFNLAAAEDWAAGADAAVVVADTNGNGITVSNVAVPTITSATYDAATGTLTVTGTGFLSAAGSNNDIVANKFTFTGEGGATHTLTDTQDGEITSGTSFTLTLSATDRAEVNQIINKNGTSSTGGTTYNLAAAEDWAAGADASVIVVDATGNGIMVSNVAVPVITGATYNGETGDLVVTGTGFSSAAGANNDIVASKLTITGEGGDTYTLSSTSNVEITSGISFALTLSAMDRSAVNAILNKNGTSSLDGTTYNLAAAADWAAGADPAVDVTDITDNGITMSNALPVVTDANISISGANGTDGAFIIGNTVTATWDNTATGDGNASVSTVTVDFSAFGGGAAVAATNSGGTWTATYTLVAGSIDATNRNVSVTATNATGSTTTVDATNAVVDNIAPVTVTDGFSPADGSPAIAPDADFEMSFSENIALGSGNIVIYDALANPVATIDVAAHSGRLTITGNQLTIDPTAVLNETASYYIQIAGGAITDLAGNAYAGISDPTTWNFTVADLTPPTVTSVEVSGSPAANAEGILFTVTFDEVPMNISTTDFTLTSTGTASANIASNSPVNANTVTVTIDEIDGTGTLRLDVKANSGITDTDGNGNGTNGFVPAFIGGELHNVDRDAPSVPEDLTLDPASDSGIVGDGITNDNTPTLNGTADANVTIAVTSDVDGVLGTTTSDDAGNWSYTSTTLLTDGTHNLTATATDAAGNTSAMSPALEITVDIIAHAKPAVPDLATASDTGESDTDNITYLANLTLQGEAGSVEANARVHARSDLEGGLTNATANTDGSWNLDVSGLVEGVHQLQITATDVAGNTSVYSDALTVTIDRTAPLVSSVVFDQASVTAANQTAISLSLVGAETETKAAFTITGDNGGTPVAVSGVPVGSATHQFTDIDVTGLDDGTLTVNLTVVDIAGNESAAVANTISKDTDVPTVSDVAIADGYYAEGDIIMVGVTLDDDVTVSGTGSTLALDIGGTTRQAGFVSENDGILVYQYTVQAGDHTGGMGVLVPSNGISLNGDIVRDAGDNDAILMFGQTGNTDAQVDTEAPVAPAVSSPAVATIVNAGDYAISGTHAENDVAVKLYLDADNDGVADNALVLDMFTVAGGAWSLTAPLIADSENNFVIIAEDATGNTSVAVDVPTIVQDSQAPAAPAALDLLASTDTGRSDSDNLTNDHAPILSGMAEPNSTVILTSDQDGVVGTGLVDGSGNWRVTVSPLNDGVHSITATATDEAGNTSIPSMALTITIDTQVPTLTAIADQFLAFGGASGPLAITLGDDGRSTADLYLTATSSNLAVVSAADIVLGGSDANRTVTVAASGSGTTTITLRAEDNAGNIGTTTFTVTVNSAPTITGTPATSVDQDVAYSFIPTGDDIDGDTLAYSIENKPDWADFDTATGELSGTPGNADVGTTTGIIIAVSDGSLTDSLAAFDLEVINVNDAPTITGTPATSVDQDLAYSFIPTGSDIDVDTLTFSIANKPDWADFDTATGELSGIPGNADVGTTTGILITVSDGTLNTSLAAFDLEVINVNDTPTISGTPATSVDQDAAYSFIPTGSDIDGDTLTFSIANKPDWATFNVATGELSGTPGNADVGVTLNIVITVSDGSLTDSLAAFDLEVINVNDAPTITGTPATSVDQDVAYSFIPTGSDIDGDTLTFSIANKPDWADFNATTGELSGTPGNDDIGTTMGITITVSDGTASASLAAFDLEVVNVNDAPTIIGTPATSVDQDVAYSFIPTGSDIDGDTLVYSIVNKPDWVDFNPVTGELSGTPGNDDVGITTGITITVSDGSLTDSLAAFDLEVVNVNDAPTITGVPEATVDQDVAYSFIPTGSDIDGDTLVYSIVNKPDWADFNPVTGEFSGTPGNDDVGITTGITITVSDGTASDSLAAFDLEVVNVNDAPTITGVPETTVDQDVAYSFIPAGSDIDGDTLTFSIANKPDWADFNPATGELSGTPGNSDVGATSDIVITVSDGTASDSLAAFDLEVVNVNDAPTITGVPETTVDQDAAYSFIPTGDDIDGDTLVYSIVNKPDWADFNPVTGELSGTPGNSDVGVTSDIVITVSDGSLTDSLAAFDLEVVNVNDAPTITGVPETTVDQDVTCSFIPAGSDIDGDTLTFSIANKPDWADFNPATGELSGTPGNDDVGITTGIIITVSDGTASDSLAAFDLEVVNVNDAPTITGTPETTVDQDVTYSFIPTGDDIDGDTLTYSITNKPDWAVFNTTTGELSGTPGNSDVGITTGIIITVSDGTLNTSFAAFDLEVINVNDAPTITGGPATSVDQDVAYSFVPTGNDIDGDTLTFSIANKPDWAVFNTTTGELSGTPGNDDVGVTSNIVITVSDGSLSASLAAFDLEVIDTDKPRVTGVEDGASYNEDVTIAFNEGTATLNGGPFVSGTTITEEADYTLVVTDAAGNETAVSFVIDKTAPSVTGVEPGGLYAGEAAASFNEGTATLDGNPYTSGTPITVAGGYTLTVADAAGNATVVDFTVGILPEAPSGLRAEAGNRQVMLEWDAPAGVIPAVSDYRIEYSRDGGTTWTVPDREASAATRSLVIGLENNRPYLFRVSAVNGLGHGAASGAVQGIPTEPVPDGDGNLPEPELGIPVVVTDGKVEAVMLEVVDSEYLRLIGEGYAMELASVGANGERIPISAAEAIIRLLKGAGTQVYVSGNGFEPGTVVTVYLFSNPELVGHLPVGADGSFGGSLPIPASLELGAHTLQTNGVVAGGNGERSVSVGLELVDRKPQWVDFGALAHRVYGDGPVALDATSTSELALTYTVTDADGNPTDIASIENNSRLHIHGAGDVLITANQAGNADYSAAAPVTRTLHIAKAPLSVSVADATRAYGAANPAFGLAYGGFVDGEDASALDAQPAAATEATETTAPGSYTITVGGGVSANYAFSYVPATLTITKASQSITINAPVEVDRDAGSIQLGVSASSGLPVALSLDDPQVATLSGTALNIHRLGTVRITATQVGDGNHEAAEPVTVTVRVTDPTSDMPIRVHKAVSPNGDGINEYLVIEAIKDHPENRVTIISRNGTVLWEASGYDNDRVVFRGIGTGQQRLPAGTYFYIAEVKVDGEWEYEKGYFVIRY